MNNIFKELVLKYKDIFLDNKYFDSDWYIEFFLEMEEIYPDFRDNQTGYLSKELESNPDFTIFYNPISLKEDEENVIKNFTETEKEFFIKYLSQFI